jgi:serine/threonine protein kinase
MGAGPSVNGVETGASLDATAAPSPEDVARRRKELGLDDDDDCFKPIGGPSTSAASPPVATPSRAAVPARAAGGGSSSTTKQQSSAPSWSPGASFKRRRIKLFTGTQVGTWRKGQLIGKGATGAVYEAIDEATNSYFAVKEIEFAEDFADNPDDRKRFDALREEVALLQQVDHPHVVRFLGIDRVGFSMYIMMDFVAGGSIASLIRRFTLLSEELTVKFTAQLVAGLAYLHSKNIIHRDIKGANVLVSDDGVVKLADFGAAKKILDPEQLQHTLAGTPYWMAPEVVRQQGHGASADVWSLGATVLQMLTGRAPYQDLAPVPALFKIGHSTDSPLPPNAAISPLARDFLSLCFMRDAPQRPKVDALKMHPWIRDAVRELAIANGTADGDDSPLAQTPIQPATVEGEVMEYLIALSFHHDDDAADAAMARRASDTSPSAANAAANTVRAVRFDDPLEASGKPAGDDDDLPPGEFDEEQFNAFVATLSNGK